nr:TetR/AcrR family transcriptional regulator [Acinetobacter lactucae]
MVIIVTKNNRGKRGRPANLTLKQTIIDAAYELFVELGFKAATLNMVAQRANISKLSIYRHFENKEALFSAVVAARCQYFATHAFLKDPDGSAEEQLMSVGSSLLCTLLSSDFHCLETMIIADRTNHKLLSKLHYEVVFAHVIRQIEALLRQLHTKAILNVPYPLQSAHLFVALFKGSNLSIIARFDEAKIEDDNMFKSYCRSAVNMFITSHGGSA